MGLQITDGDDGIQLNPYYELEPCTREHMTKFIPENAIVWYAQPICFKNRDNVEMNKSWWYNEFNSPAIGILYCQNTTENQSWCKSIEDIEAWLMDHNQYFIYQETRVSADIWSDHPNID